MFLLGTVSIRWWWSNLRNTIGDLPSNAGGPSSIPGEGTRSRMPQLKDLHAATKISRAATKTQHSQINKYFFKKEKRNAISGRKYEFMIKAEICMNYNCFWYHLQLHFLPWIINYKMNESGNRKSIWPEVRSPRI